jgi:hypothetical protein
LHLKTILYPAQIIDSEGKRSVGRPRRRWEDIELDLKEIVMERADWIHLAQYVTGDGLL